MQLQFTRQKPRNAGIDVFHSILSIQRHGEKTHTNNRAPKRSRTKMFARHTRHRWQACRITAPRMAATSRLCWSMHSQNGSLFHCKFKPWACVDVISFVAACGRMTENRHHRMPTCSCSVLEPLIQPETGALILHHLGFRRNSSRESAFAIDTGIKTSKLDGTNITS